MIAQWAKGLDEPIQKSGCLFLCYLWVGWLWALGDRGRMQETAYPTVDTINVAYDFLRIHGSIGEDCFVRKPGNVVAFPWHYWDDCELRGKTPEVVVEKVAPHQRGHVWPLQAIGDISAPSNGGWRVEITRWEWQGRSHFTALGDDRAAYFDPWMVSRIVQEGTAESVRRVTLVSK